MAAVEIDFLYQQTKMRLVPFAAGDLRPFVAFPIQSIESLNKLDIAKYYVNSYEVQVVCFDHYKLDYSLRSTRRGASSKKIKRFDIEVLERGRKWKRKLRWAAEVVDARRGSGLIRLRLKIWGEEIFEK